MANPSSPSVKQRQPDRYRDGVYYVDPATDSSDHGGVHTNSGILNHAAYEMARLAPEVSTDTWAKIWYESLLKLDSYAGYLSVRQNVIAVAKDILPSYKVQAVRQAFDHVNILDSQTTHQVNFQLKWGEYPLDLDLHVTGPAGGGDRFHVYYSDKTYYSQNDEKIAELDFDDIDSYGPETISIQVSQPGIYRIYVHDFSNHGEDYSTALMESGAVVSAYKGVQSQPFYSSEVPQEDGTLWGVLEYNSETQQITQKNIMSYDFSEGDEVGATSFRSVSSAGYADLARVLHDIANSQAK